ncbi:MAG TPA: T9SS type A sorting domain-containing protein, partial [Candidatus Krumholzibacterium sp.]|nr:T9SS type A sorting domain-containing protein [Candidatus Krumholzibacterium sp.]
EQTLDIAEGQTGSVSVRLSSVPSADVTLGVTRLTGDGDLSVSSGAVLVFTPMDWYLEQTVVITAEEDVDEENGQAVIRIEGVSGPETGSADIIVNEIDNDTGDANNGNLAAAMIAIYPMPYQPANGSLTIGNLPSSGRAGIFDLRGQKVWNETWDGSDTIVWNGVNDSGASVASGRYFLVITSADGQVAEKRVILVVN